MTSTTNGQHPPASAPREDEGASPSSDGPTATLASLREHQDNVHLFRGYGPLVVGIILFVLMVTLAPTVAPERIVERPVNVPETTAP